MLISRSVLPTNRFASACQPLCRQKLSLLSMKARTHKQIALTTGCLAHEGRERGDGENGLWGLQKQKKMNEESVRRKKERRRERLKEDKEERDIIFYVLERVWKLIYIITRRSLWHVG